MFRQGLRQRLRHVDKQLKTLYVMLGLEANSITPAELIALRNQQNEDSTVAKENNYNQRELLCSTKWRDQSRHL